MLTPRTVRHRRWRLPAALAALVAALALAPAAGAQEGGPEPPGDTGVAVVTAAIETTSILSLTLCDTTVDFGTGLDAFGAPAQGTSDPVVALAAPPSGSGAAIPGGAIYRWEPACLTTAMEQGTFLQIQSTVPWRLGTCATENSGTNPNLKIAEGDLRWNTVAFTSYDSSLGSSFPFDLCTETALGLGVSEVASGVGNSTADAWYYLRIDRDDAGGTFHSTTIWEVTP